MEQIDQAQDQAACDDGSNLAGDIDTDGMHEQEILDSILSRLDTEGCAVHCISLICSQEALRARLQKDVDAGIRTEDVMGRSIPRLAQYEKLNTRKIDVTQLSPEDAAERILRYTQAQQPVKGCR